VRSRLKRSATKEEEVGRVVVTEFVSVDGVIEDPGGAEGFDRGGWAFQFERGEDGDKFKLEETLEAEAQLLGRVTFEGFAAAWPSRSGEFADKFNNMPKYVVSTTLEDPEWANSTVINGDLAEEIGEVKRDVDGVVLVSGSATLVHSLAEAELVDEYRLMIFPLILGAGKRLFADTSSASALRLLESRPVGPDGVVVSTYAPK
jgi:dihydrofolate reductase